MSGEVRAFVVACVLAVCIWVGLALTEKGAATHEPDPIRVIVLNREECGR